jgi:uncharacterized membrane protein YeaQ/YmgE (transglycosylase-associated protein family)
MTIIWTIIIGFVIGLLARALMPGRDPGGFIITTVIGIAGALVGSFVGQALGFYAQGEPVGMIMSVLGAILLLVGYRYLVPTTSTSRL